MKSYVHLEVCIPLRNSLKKLIYFENPVENNISFITTILCTNITLIYTLYHFSHTIFILLSFYLKINKTRLKYFLIFALIYFMFNKAVRN